MKLKTSIFRLILILNFSFFIFHSVKAQNQHIIDSLKKVIADIEKVCPESCLADTGRIIAYIRWGEKIYRQQPDSAVLLWKKSVQIVKNLFATKSISVDVNSTKKYLSSAFNNIGYIYESQGNIQGALEYHYKSLNIRKEIGNKIGMSTSFNNIGVIYMNQGDIPRALEYYHKSLNIKEEIGNKKGMSTSFNNIGVIYGQQGNIPKQMEYYHKSLSIREELGDKHGMAQSYNNIGYVYGNQSREAKSKQDIAGSDSLINKAMECFHKSLNVREEIGDKKGIATSFNNIGYIYQMQARNAKYRQDTVGSDSLINKAMEYFHKGLKIREEIGDKHGIVYSLYNLGGGSQELNDVLLLKKYAVKSYKLSKELGFPENIKNTASLMKSLRIVQNNYASADSFILEGIDINNRSILSNFATLSETGQEKYFNNVAGNYMDFNSYALKRKQDNPKIVNYVFNNTVKNKGLLLKSSTAMRNAVLSSEDTVLIDNYYKWIHLKKKIAKLYSRGKDTKELEKQANEFEKELVKGSQLFSDFKNLQNITWQDVQKGLKPNEAAIEFIHFRYKNYESNDFTEFTDTTLYCALIVTPESKTPEMLPLFKEKDLENILGKFGGNNYSYINGIYGQNNKAKTELYNLIWQPIDSVLNSLPFVEGKGGASTVYLSPSGLLHKVSFAALCKEQNVYLCDNYNIEVKSSTGKITGNQDLTQSEVLTNATLFGGIIYNTDSTQTKLLPAGRQVWNYLEGTKTETEKIDKILKKGKVQVNYFSNTTATEEEFKLMASNSNILHIATHGFFYPDPKEIKKETEEKTEHGDMAFRGGERGFGVGSFVENNNPLMRSGLVFAGANDVWNKQERAEGDDGVLTAQEVAHIDMRKTNLVVMSACETGLGDIKGSEGVYGLQRAFKMAGVKYMIMSLWQVPDKETEEFMTTFYTKLLKLKDIKQASNQTQKEMRKKYDPYFWAAFVLIE